jgi:hypothetical protein
MPGKKGTDVDKGKLRDAAAGAVLLGDAHTYHRIEQALGGPVVVPNLSYTHAHRQRCITAHAKAQALATLGIPLADLDR